MEFMIKQEQFAFHLMDVESTYAGRAIQLEILAGIQTWQILRKQPSCQI